MADDKKVKITGEVKIDTAQAQGDVQSLKAEFVEFKAELTKITAGISLILRSLASMANGMDATAADAKNVATATSDAADAVEQLTTETKGANEEVEEQSSLWKEIVAEGLAGVVEGMQEASKETTKLNGRAEVTRGLFQRIGHLTVDGLVAGLRGLVKYFASLIDDAGEFDTIFDKMAARGVDNVKAMQVAVVELAGAMGEDLLEVAQSANLAESLGAGADAVEVARAAWENYRVTGMDVTRQIEVSSRVTRAFNLTLQDQVDLIRRMGQVSQQANISQDMLWNGIESIGPKIEQLGGNYQDMISIIQAAASKGIKIEDDGPQGANQLFDALISGAEDLGRALLEVGKISTASSAQWTQVRSELDAQTSSFKALNDQVKEYKREATEIGLLVGDARSLIDTYTALSTKKAEGHRLNKLERAELRETAGAISAANQELSKYDAIGLIVQNREFKRLSTIEQLEKRMVAAKEAQAQLNVESQKADLLASVINDKMATTQASLTALSTAVKAEMPAAIQAAIGGEGGLAGFLTMLGETPEALKQLPASVQSLLQAIGPELAAAKAAITLDATEIGTQFTTLQTTATGSFTQLKESLATIATTLMLPIAEALNRVSGVVMEKLTQPFKGSKETMYEAVAVWAQETADSIISTFNDYVAGKTSLSGMLREWWTKALEEVKRLWAEYVQPIVDGFVLELESRIPALKAQLETWFTEMGKAAGEAFRKGIIGSGIYGIFDSIGKPMQDFFYNQMTSQGNTDRLNTYMGGMSGNPTGMGYGSSASTQGAAAAPININVNGAGDTKAVVNEVIHSLAQQERLGNTGSRLR